MEVVVEDGVARGRVVDRKEEGAAEHAPADRVPRLPPRDDEADEAEGRDEERRATVTRLEVVIEHGQHDRLANGQHERQHGDRDRRPRRPGRTLTPTRGTYSSAVRRSLRVARVARRPCSRSARPPRRVPLARRAPPSRPCRRSLRAAAFAVVGYVIARAQPRNPMARCSSCSVSTLFDYAVRLYLVLDYRNRRSPAARRCRMFSQGSWSILPVPLRPDGDRPVPGPPPLAAVAAGSVGLRRRGGRLHGPAIRRQAVDGVSLSSLSTSAVRSPTTTRNDGRRGLAARAVLPSRLGLLRPGARGRIALVVGVHRARLK